MHSITEFIKKHLTLIMVVLVTTGLVLLFHYLNWWEAIGLIILKFGLGVKVQGAKTFAVAVAKAGGKKALLLTTTGVLLKRHIIDMASKFFAEHSVSRYKDNVIQVLKIKALDLKNSTLGRKIKYMFGVLGSIPLLYGFWTKVLGTAIQKFLYAVALPLFAVLWELLLTGFNFLTGLISFIFQVTLLNYFVRWLESYKLGRLMIKFMFETVKFLANILDVINDLFVKIGLDPKHRLIMWSIKFNRKLEKIILKGENSRSKIQKRREIHRTTREILMLERAAFKEKKVKKPSFTKRTKELFRKKVLKQKTWKEKRIARAEKKKR